MLAIAGIAAAVLAIALFQTRNLPLIDRDEGRYAEAARELRASGEWLVPRLYGVAYLEKPPLFYWATASAYALVGEDELGARLTPAVAAALGVLVTGLFGARYLSGRAGVLAAATLASSGLYFVLARVVVTDMLFTVLIASALMAFFVADRERRSFLPFWILAAAATLTKGPVAAVLCALVVIAHLAVERRLARIFAVDFLAGLAVYLPIVGTWLCLLETRFPGFFAFYVYKEHVLRVAGDEHREAFWWYGPWLLVGFLPWTPAWIAALPGTVRAMRGESERASALRFAGLWAVAILVFFSISRGKLVPYILPIFPALAIQLGDALDRWIGGDRVIPGIRLGFLGLGLALFAAAAVLPIVAHMSPVVVPRSTVAAAVVFGLSVAIVVLATHRRRDATPVAAIAAAIALLECVGAAIAAPIARPLTAMPAIEILRARLTPEDAFAAYGGYFPNVPFYLRRIPYFVGGNRELDFGISLEGNGPWVVDDLEALWKRIGRRRTFFLLRTRERDLNVLLALPGKVTLVHRGRTSSLVEVEP
jgi:4-amino-4-deoxy-L-arabinose transferase-like glycosyltransferase